MCVFAYTFVLNLHDQLNIYMNHSSIFKEFFYVILRVKSVKVNNLQHPQFFLRIKKKFNIFTIPLSLSNVV